MPAKKLVRVRAVQNPDGSPRLYPRPGGVHQGHVGWLGWQPSFESDADHFIEGAAGIAMKPGPKGQVYDPDRTTSDGFPRGPDIYLKRMAEGEMTEETMEIRTAFRCGDLLLVCEGCKESLVYGQEHACATPSLPTMPRTGTRRGG